MTTSVEKSGGKLRKKKPAVYEYDTKESAMKLARETRVLEFHMGSPGFKPTIDAADLEQQQADNAAISAAKKLFSNDDLKAVRRHNDRMGRWIKSRAVPCNFFKGSMYVIPLDLVEEVDERIAAYETELAEILDKIEARYEDIIKGREVHLQKLFDRDDYPEFDHIRDLYKCEYRIFSMNFAAAIEELNRDITAKETRKVQGRLAEIERREASKIADDLQSAGSVCRDLLRAEFAKLVKNMTARLAVNDGKPATFKDTLIPNVKDFLSVANFRDFTNDAEVRKMVDRLNQVVDGVETASLRDDMALRAKVLAEFSTAEKSLDKLMNVKGRRFNLPGKKLTGALLTD